MTQDGKAKEAKLTQDSNPWKLNPEEYTLELFSPSAKHWVYAVDLETCTDSAHMLDLIFQINTQYQDIPEEQVIVGLNRLLNEILHPQATLCSMGNSKTLTRAQIRALVDEYVKEGSWKKRRRK